MSSDLHDRIARLNGHATGFSEKPESLEPSFFPVDALPPLLADVIEPAAATFALPASFYALPLLGSVAAAIGNAAEVELRPGQRERAILWLACIGRPGSGKSPAFDLARQPLDRLQEVLWRAWRDQRGGWEALPKDQRPDRRPVLESVLAGDTTTEALAALLPATRGLLVARDELSAWALGMGQYKRGAGADRASWLSLWSGAAMKIDRKSDDPVFVARPTVSLAGGIQPDALPALRGEAALDDGLLDRLLVAWPAARVPRWSEAAFDETPLDRLADALRVLRGHIPAEPPATIVRLDPAAKRTWIAWFNDNAATIEQGSGLGAGFASKLSRHVPRIALVLHAAADPDGLARPISDDTLTAAIDLSEYFRHEHGRMLVAIGAGVGTEPAGVPGRVLRYLRRVDGAWMSRTELLDRLRNVPADRLTEAIATLEDDGLAETRCVSTATRPRDEVRLRHHPFQGFGDFGESTPDGGETPNHLNPSNGRESGIWVCSGCGKPRSRAPGACPACGSQDGHAFKPQRGAA